MRRENKFLITIIFLAFASRFLPSLILHYPIENDAAQYDNIAKNLVASFKYSTDGLSPSIERVPGYPTFLALIYKIFGYQPSFVIFIQVILSTLIVYLTYLLIKLIFPANYELPGLIAAALVAIYPLFIYYPLFLYSEIFAAVLLLSSVIFFVLATTRKALGLLLISATLLIIFILTKPLFAPISLLYLIYIIIYFRGNNLTAALFAFLCPVIIIWGAWIYRNQLAFGQPIPLGIGLGPVLFAGNYADFNAVFPGYEVLNKIIPNPGLSDIEYDNYLKKMAIREIWKNPLATTKLFIYKTAKYLTVVRNFSDLKIFAKGAGDSAANRLLFISFFTFYKVLKLLILPFFILGSGLVIKNYQKTENKLLILILLISLYGVVAHALLYVDERYHLVAFPLHIILAVYGSLFLINQYKYKMIFPVREE